MRPAMAWTVHITRSINPLISTTKATTKEATVNLGVDTKKVGSTDQGMNPPALSFASRSSRVPAEPETTASQWEEHEAVPSEGLGWSSNEEGAEQELGQPSPYHVRISVPTTLAESNQARSERAGELLMEAMHRAIAQARNTGPLPGFDTMRGLGFPDSPLSSPEADSASFSS
eukprot:6224892-Amphidinium_carterae.1